MAESSKDLEVQGQPNKIGPDIIGFCKSEILELLTLDESSLSLSFSTPHVSSDTPENVKEAVEVSHVSTMFSNSMDDSMSNIKRELLKTSLRKSVKAITHEVDEMLDPIVRLRHLMSCLGSKRKAPIAEDSGTQLRKKLKISSSDGGRGLLVDQSGNADNETDVSVDLKVLLESEDDLVEDIMTKHSDELHVTLNNMEKQLEELLFAVVSKCRPMTCEEKHHLRKLIQKLPSRNLGRIVEIIHHGKSKSSSDTVSADKIYVDLEEQDNTTLWRLYFYVKAVENARKLSS